jgi:hypothetical protein
MLIKNKSRKPVPARNAFDIFDWPTIEQRSVQLQNENGATSSCIKSAKFAKNLRVREKNRRAALTCAAL